MTYQIDQSIKIESLPEPYITFKKVGKHSAPHLIGYKAMKNKNRGIVVIAKEVIKYYEKINKS